MAGVQTDGGLRGQMKENLFHINVPSLNAGRVLLPKLDAGVFSDWWLGGPDQNQLAV